MPKTINKNCLYCKKKFDAFIKELNRGNGKFCSRSCFGKFRSANKIPKLPNMSCFLCNKSFYRPPNKLKNSKSGLYFCSRSCKDQAQRITSNIAQIQPDHYGTGKYVDYRTLAFNNYPHKCNKCGYHAHVDVLEVHHLDQNRSNNKLKNLVISCPTCHTETHRGHK